MEFPLTLGHDKGIPFYADLIFQTMVGIQQVQSGAMLARPSNTVLHRDDGVAPAVHDDRRAGNVLRRVLLVARHVQSGGEQK